MRINLIFIITLGLCFLIFNKPIAHWLALLYDKIGVGQVKETFLRIGYVVVGLFFIISGLIELFNK